VTGFVRSNILHHGLVAPDGSLYLPIKENIENIKYQGNENGMATEVYARSVVRKLMGKNIRPEIWEGNMAWTIHFLVGYLPLWLLVSICSLIKSIRLIILPIVELVILPQISTWSPESLPGTMKRHVTRSTCGTQNRPN
jgi:hypothetical protein